VGDAVGLGELTLEASHGFPAHKGGVPKNGPDRLLELLLEGAVGSGEVEKRDRKLWHGGGV
jgi:hypothetical protein